MLCSSNQQGMSSDKDYFPQLMDAKSSCNFWQVTNRSASCSIIPETQSGAQETDVSGKQAGTSKDATADTASCNQKVQTGQAHNQQDTEEKSINLSVACSAPATGEPSVSIPNLSELDERNSLQDELSEAACEAQDLSTTVSLVSLQAQDAEAPLCLSAALSLMSDECDERDGKSAGNTGNEHKQGIGDVNKDAVTSTKDLSPHQYTLSQLSFGSDGAPIIGSVQQNSQKIETHSNVVHTQSNVVHGEPCGNEKKLAALKEKSQPALQCLSSESNNAQLNTTEDKAQQGRQSLEGEKDLRQAALKSDQQGSAVSNLAAPCKDCMPSDGLSKFCTPSNSVHRKSLPESCSKTPTPIVAQSVSVRSAQANSRMSGDRDNPKSQLPLHVSNISNTLIETPADLLPQKSLKRQDNMSLALRSSYSCGEIEESSQHNGTSWDYRQSQHQAEQSMPTNNALSSCALQSDRIQQQAVVKSGITDMESKEASCSRQEDGHLSHSRCSRSTGLTTQCHSEMYLAAIQNTSAQSSEMYEGSPRTDHHGFAHARIDENREPDGRRDVTETSVCLASMNVDDQSCKSQVPQSPLGPSLPQRNSPIKADSHGQTACDLSEWMPRPLPLPDLPMRKSQSRCKPI